MFSYAVEVVKRSQQQSFQIPPNRWIVDHTFAWLNWSRRLSKGYELNHSSAETPLPTNSCAASLRFQACVKGGVKGSHWGGVNVWSAAFTQPASEG
jgi:hypothetical protein